MIITWVATYASDAMLTLIMLCNFVFPWELYWRNLAKWKYIWMPDYQQWIRISHWSCYDYLGQEFASKETIPCIMLVILEVLPQENWPLISWNHVSSIPKPFFSPLWRLSLAKLWNKTELTQNQINPVQRSKESSCGIVVESAINLLVVVKGWHKRNTL